ncbi:MAG: hypothetical protein EHM61_21645 [Acidobacteria bacterium]|nr:MAG: hypothetical protein EHM61_21645 [Acidobacteriota bacterium]
MAMIDVPPDWERLAETCLADRLRKIMVVGAADRGKSTLCRFLVSCLAQAGAGSVLVDADVGQKDVGPPASITRGFLRAASDPYSLEMDALYFIGATTPVRHLLPMVIGTRSLVNASREGFVVVNTTGFVRGVGYALKSYKIEALRPDLLIVVDPGGETAAITSSFPQRRTVRLTPSARVVVKSRETRRAARERAFSGYFAGSSRIELPIDALTFQRDPGFVAALALTQGARRTRFSLPQPNLLCGLCDGDQRCLGCGILLSLDLRAGIISFLTPVPAARVQIVQFGDLYLNPDGEELGRRR